MFQLVKNKFNKRPGPLVLVILDGVGLGPKNEGNAFYRAATPNFDNLKEKFLVTSLQAHGKAVGLPSDGDMGNSEVGHNVLGAGRIFAQGAKLVNQAIISGEIFTGSAWQQTIKNVLEKESTLHFIGLLSDGNVHSHYKHLFKMIDQAAVENLKKIRIHVLLDGRDVPEKSALIYVDKLEEKLEKLQKKGFDYQIASGGGRMITTMDRYEADWDIVARGWQAHVLGESQPFSSAREAILFFREDDPNLIDQYLPPFTIVDQNGPVGKIKDNDAVIFFNFRGDRALQITRAFTEKDFNKFDRKIFPNVFFAGMMQYDGDLGLPENYLVSPPKIDKTLSEYLVKNNITQYAISETQKFGHVTYFWNGNRSGKFSEDLETYVEIPSDKIEFNKKPEMKALEITNQVIKEIKKGSYNFIRLNLANGDMVGHTGDLAAAIKAAEIVDQCLGKIMQAVEENQGVAIITADHGNLEEMYEIDKKTGDLKIDSQTGQKKNKTSHTLNRVPFIIFDSLDNNEYQLVPNLQQLGLANVASTLLFFLGFEPPLEYEPSLVKLV